MRKLPFVQVDVFTRNLLEGNQLVVFTDARSLSDTEMQRIAKETNLSETTFIFPRNAETEQRDGVRVRIFTVEEELPFAGHPSLGTASVIRSQTGSDSVELALKVGKIPVFFRVEANGDLAFGEMRQPDPEFGEIHSAEEIARIASLSPDDLRSDLVIQTVSTGNPCVLVPVKTLAAIQRIRFDHAAAQDYLKTHSGKFIYFITAESTRREAQFHARMIFYNGEDPATGSAAGPAIAWLVKYGQVRPGERVMIEQGVEIGRRSHLYVRAKIDNGRIGGVFVGGYTVEVARGEYRLP